MLLLDKLVGIAAPHQCLVCGREGGLLCAWCAPDAITALPSRCYRCSAQTEDFKTCPKCRRVSRLKHVWIRTNLDKLARRLIYDYKFKHARAAAHDIAGQMVQCLPYFADSLLVPVPTATSRVRQRGFDHTELLARVLSRPLGLEKQIILRRLGQSRQVGTKRQQRIKQVAGCFQITKAIKDKKILLVDDVLTTGATLEEAARVLKQAGAKQVDAIVFAQAR
jgi:ComF family protein